MNATEQKTKPPITDTVSDLQKALADALSENRRLTSENTELKKKPVSLSYIPTLVPVDFDRLKENPELTKKLVHRDGAPVGEIILLDEKHYTYPILELVDMDGAVRLYRADGRLTQTGESCWDLLMPRKTVTKWLGLTPSIGYRSESAARLAFVNQREAVFISVEVPV